MIKFFVAAAAAGAVLLLPVTADASSSVKHFKNCTAMHKTYKHGIAKSTAAWHNEKKHGNGLKGHKPKISASLYKANKTMDRDKDGVACEK